MSASEYSRILEHLFSLRRFGSRPGLEVVRKLLDALGRPEETFPAVHITGSKGKGSVAAMTAEILSASVGPTGLFTSPHLVSYRERIRVDREPIPVDAVVRGVGAIEELSQTLLRQGAIDRAPTFFEVTTALAFDYFRSKGVHQAVVEVGLGGRLDSTNVLDAPVGVITTIELEHTDILGPTLADIAREKGGILRRGMTAVLGEIPEVPAALLLSLADSLGIPVVRLGREIRVSDRTLDRDGQTFSVHTSAHEFPQLRIPLLGNFQPGNAALAIAAADRFEFARGHQLPESAIRDGLRKVRWRGRLERLLFRPPLFLDVAHTPESARAVAQSLGEIVPFSDRTRNAILFGCLSGKSARAILDALAPLAATLVLAPVRSDRTMTPEGLRSASQGLFPTVVQARSAAEGLPLARAATFSDGYTLAVGSDYLVGEVLRVVEEISEDEPDLSDPAVVQARKSV